MIPCQGTCCRSVLLQSGVAIINRRRIGPGGTMQVKGKVVVVTGGANGIGRALCMRFAAEGAKAVIVADIDREGVDRVVGEIAAHTEAAGMNVDVSNEFDIQELVAWVHRRYGL